MNQNYDNYQHHYTREVGYFNGLARKIRKIYPETGIRILDIGCGYGDFLLELMKQYGSGAEYHGMTVTQKEFGKMQNALDINPELMRQQDVDKLFPAKYFDIIINFLTLSYCTYQDQMITVRKMIDGLKSGGILMLCTMPDWVKDKEESYEQGEKTIQFSYNPQIWNLIKDKMKLVWQTKYSGNTDLIRRLLKREYLVQVWKKQ